MKNAVILLAQGFEEVEALTCVDYLRRAGVEMTMLAVTSGNEVEDGISKVDAVRIVESSHRVRVVADMTLSYYMKRGMTPSLIIVPGGMPGAPNVAANKDAIALLNKVWDSGGIVAAICAAPVVVLNKAGLLKGKNFTCFPGMVNDYAKDCASKRQEVPVVVDGNLVTGRGAGATEEFVMQLVKMLCGEDTYRNVREKTCQRLPTSALGD